jgi:hypothetical protein
MGRPQILSIRPARSPRVLAQQADGATVLLSLDEGTYFRLNEVGALIWDLCDGDHTVGEIVDAISAEYDASLDQVGADVISLVEELSSERLLVEPL